MKKIMVAVIAAALAYGAVAETSVTTEVYVNVPGNQAVHCPSAVVTFLGDNIVKVETPWGVTYTTHISNVVLVTRKNGGQRK